jgi:hypothetical protein
MFNPSVEELKQDTRIYAGETHTMKIAKETWIILAIGLADLATTIIFIQQHGAQEANPLFKRYWEMGLAAFVAAKFALLVGPLYVLEWARPRNPRFVSWALRSAIVAYLMMYGVGYVRLNHRPRVEPEIAYASPPAIDMAEPLNLPAPPKALLHQRATGVHAQEASQAVSVY